MGRFVTAFLLCQGVFVLFSGCFFSTEPEKKTGEWQYKATILASIREIYAPESSYVNDTLTISFKSNVIPHYPQLDHYESDRDSFEIKIKVYAKIHDWVGTIDMPPSSDVFGASYLIAPPFYKGPFVVGFVQPDSSLLSDTVIMVE